MGVCFLLQKIQGRDLFHLEPKLGCGVRRYPGLSSTITCQLPATHLSPASSPPQCTGLLGQTSSGITYRISIGRGSRARSMVFHCRNSRALIPGLSFSKCKEYSLMVDCSWLEMCFFCHLSHLPVKLASQTFSTSAETCHSKTLSALVTYADFVLPLY